MIHGDNDRVLVCARVGDAAVVVAGAAVRRCHACGRPVWVSPASRTAAGPDAAIECIPCFQKNTAPGFKSLPWTPEQLREVRDALERKGE